MRINTLMLALCLCFGMAMTAGCGGDSQTRAQKLESSDLIIAPTNANLGMQLLSAQSTPTTETLKNSGRGVLTLKATTSWRPTREEATK